MKKQSKPRLKLALAAFIAFTLSLAYFSTVPPSISAMVEKSSECSDIHWHAVLKIYLHGEPVVIPPNTGINIGVMDTDISGVPYAPVHTHGSDNTLHIESICLEKKPEILQLRYFFKIWGEEFNEECVMDKCEDAINGIEMKVNGVASNAFEKHVLRDGDEVVITYGKKRVKPSQPVI